MNAQVTYGEKKDPNVTVVGVVNVEHKAKYLYGVTMVSNYSFIHSFDKLVKLVNRCESENLLI